MGLWVMSYDKSLAQMQGKTLLKLKTIHLPRGPSWMQDVLWGNTAGLGGGCAALCSPAGRAMERVLLQQLRQDD